VKLAAGVIEAHHLSAGADGGGNAGDVVGGGVAGFVVDGAVAGDGTLFGGGRSGPLMPQAATPATATAIVAAHSARLRMD